MFVAHLLAFCILFTAISHVNSLVTDDDDYEEEDFPYSSHFENPMFQNDKHQFIVGRLVNPMNEAVNFITSVKDRFPFLLLNVTGRRFDLFKNFSSQSPEFAKELGLALKNVTRLFSTMMTVFVINNDNYTKIKNIEDIKEDEMYRYQFFFEKPPKYGHLGQYPEYEPIGTLEWTSLCQMLNFVEDLHKPPYMLYKHCVETTNGFAELMQIMNEIFRKYDNFSEDFKNDKVFIKYQPVQKEIEEKYKLIQNFLQNLNEKKDADYLEELLAKCDKHDTAELVANLEKRARRLLKRIDRNYFGKADASNNTLNGYYMIMTNVLQIDQVVAICNPQHEVLSKIHEIKNMVSKRFNFTLMLEHFTSSMYSRYLKKIDPHVVCYHGGPESQKFLNTLRRQLEDVFPYFQFGIIAVLANTMHTCWVKNSYMYELEILIPKPSPPISVLLFLVIYREKVGADDWTQNCVINFTHPVYTCETDKFSPTTYPEKGSKVPTVSCNSKYVVADCFALFYSKDFMKEILLSGPPDCVENGLVVSSKICVY